MRDREPLPDYGEEEEPEPIKPEPKKKTVQLLAPIASEKEVSLSICNTVPAPLKVALEL